VTREVHAPKGRHSGRHKVYCSVYRDWNTLCQNRPGPMRRCYIELADNPFPPVQTNRHHQLKGKLKGFWEYEVDGGARVRYKRGPDDRVVVLVVYAGLPRQTPTDRCVQRWFSWTDASLASEEGRAWQATDEHFRNARWERAWADLQSARSEFVPCGREVATGETLGSRTKR